MPTSQTERQTDIQTGQWSDSIGQTVLQTVAQKSSKLASFAQLQFNSINICLFSIELPILVKIYPAVIEILTFNKWSLKFTVSRSVLFYLLSLELTDVSMDAIVALAKQKQTRMWANAQRDGRPAEYRSRPLFNAAKFG